MRGKQKPVEGWQTLVDHISQTWEKKKGRKYPFTGKDFKLLKTLCRWGTVYEVMALWTVYLAYSDFWGPKTGWLVDGLFAERGRLIDHPDVKRLSARYETEDGLTSAKQITLELGLKGGTI